MEVFKWADYGINKEQFFLLPAFNYNELNSEVLNHELYVCRLVIDYYYIVYVYWCYYHEYMIRRRVWQKLIDKRIEYNGNRGGLDKIFSQ